MEVALTRWQMGRWSTQAKVEGIGHDAGVAIAVPLTIPLGNQAAPHCMQAFRRLELTASPPPTNPPCFVGELPKWGLREIWMNDSGSGAFFLQELRKGNLD